MYIPLGCLVHHSAVQPGVGEGVQNWGKFLHLYLRGSEYCASENAILGYLSFREEINTCSKLVNIVQHLLDYLSMWYIDTCGFKCKEKCHRVRRMFSKFHKLQQL